MTNFRTLLKQEKWSHLGDPWSKRARRSWLRHLKQREGVVIWRVVPQCPGVPGGWDSQESACNARDLGWIPGLGKSPWEGNSYQLQYSGLENPHGKLQSMGSQRVGHDWVSFTFTSTVPGSHLAERRQPQLAGSSGLQIDLSTTNFLPENSHLISLCLSPFI